jgi:small redox-active disulfide protein 2
MEIKILGTGCSKCKSLEKIIKEVVAENNYNAQITKVEDIVQIMGYGVMSTPALVIDEKVAISGRIPSKEEIKQQIDKAQNV